MKLLPLVITGAIDMKYYLLPLFIVISAGLPAYAEQSKPALFSFQEVQPTKNISKISRSRRLKRSSAVEITATPNEGDVNHVNYFRLAIPNALNIDASVSYQTKNRSAIAGEDYIETSGTATILAGKTETLIAVTIIADSTPEPDESFDLTIKNPVGAVFPSSQSEISVTHTIIDNDSSIITASHRLKRTSNDFEATLKKLMLQTYAKISPPIYYIDDVMTGAVTEAGDAGATIQTSSSTNNQVNGVDEADRLKNDDNYLYVASSQTATIKAYSTLAGNATSSDKITIDTNNNQRISGLYLLGEKLIALSSTNQYQYDMWFAPNYWQNRSTRLHFLTAKEGKLSKENELEVDGQMVNSRRIGSTLYVVTRHTPSLKDLITYPVNEQDVATNRALIEAATLSDLLPDYSLNGTNKGDILSTSNCFTTEYTETEHQQIGIINVLAIDLENPTEKPKGSCFIGDAEALYVSTKALYLATTQYAYQMEDNRAIYDPQITTDIHKFSLNGLDINYKGSAEVNGHLGWQQDLKSFRMGEFKVGNSALTPDSESIFGIITYTGSQVSTTASPARLYTLQEDLSKAGSLKVLAQLPNNKYPAALGKPGEQIYATRFIGNKAYLVTFRTTDPLYILDLSNPADPFVAGELQVNGYSDYLHPIGENFILGIGKDAIPAIDSSGDARGAWYQGVKLSLIDISNPQLPVEVWNKIIGKRGTNTTVSTTHHAFTTLQQDNTLKIALPISYHQNDQPVTPDEPPRTYHDWKYNALYRYEINTLTGALSEQEMMKSSTINNDNDYNQWQDDRSAIMGNKVHYLKGDEIISRDW